MATYTWELFISAKDLIRIYMDRRKGIFFENVRDFLGLDASNTGLEINNEIFKTASEEPEKMLERNNGITFKASNFSLENDNIILEEAGIINGCQTTMCIFEAKAKPLDDCFVPVKIVIADIENASKVAKTANNQNKIEKINLELSEYLRPQLVKMSLSEIGVELLDTEPEDEEQKEEDQGRRKNKKSRQLKDQSVISITSAISQQRIFYADLRYLFIGLFSYKPRNIFISDYASIKFDEIRKAYPNEEDKKYLIRVISSLLVKANEVFDNLKFQYPAESNDEDSQAQTGKIFNRFYTNEKGYKSYLIIFAICCMLNISNEEKFKVKSVKEIIEKINLVIGEKEQEFREALDKAFRTIAHTTITHFASKVSSINNDEISSREIEKEIRQNLFRYLKSNNFSTFYLTYGLNR
jgi:hypothetical protein